MARIYITPSKNDSLDNRVSAFLQDRELSKSLIKIFEHSAFILGDSDEDGCIDACLEDSDGENSIYFTIGKDDIYFMKGYIDQHIKIMEERSRSKTKLK